MIVPGVRGTVVHLVRDVITVDPLRRESQGQSGVQILEKPRLKLFPSFSLSLVCYEFNCVRLSALQNREILVASRILIAGDISSKACTRGDCTSDGGGRTSQPLSLRFTTDRFTRKWAPISLPRAYVPFKNRV